MKAPAPGYTYVVRLPTKGPSEMIMGDGWLDEGDDLFADNVESMTDFIVDGIVSEAGLYFMGTVCDDGDTLHGQLITVQRNKDNDLYAIAGMMTITPTANRVNHWPPKS